MRYVIIGGSIAGISAVKAIRAGNADAEITVISREKAAPYYRPMIPYLIETNEIDISFVDDPIKVFGINLVSEAAVKLNRLAKEILLTSGEKVGYDKLLIATGSGPVVPDIPGIEGPGVFTLKTRDDALGIRSYVSGRKKAVVLGGGFIGLKAAIALRHIGLEVTVVEKLDRILSQRLDRRGSEIISKAMRDSGITLLTDETIIDILRKGDAVHAVRLSSGTILEADVITLAIGVRPNADVFVGSGIAMNRGILISESLQTNDPDIYAAGDVVEFKDLITGAPSMSLLWTNAEEMGKFAGRNMSGGNVRYRGFLSVMNATEIFGIPVISVGMIEPEGTHFETIVDDNIDGYRKLVFKDDLLVGVVLIGDVKNAGIYTNLIKNRIPIGNLKEEAIKGSLTYVNFIRTGSIPSLTV